MLFWSFASRRCFKPCYGAALLMLALSAPATAQLRLEHQYPQVQPTPVVPQPTPPPAFCKPGQICLVQPPGVTVDRLGKDELQIWGQQQEIKQLQAQIATLQATNAQMANQLATLLPAFQNLQSQYASHTHTYVIDTPGGYSTGWTLFDLTEHGGHNVTVGLAFTCAPGLDRGCAQRPPGQIASQTSGPVPPKQ